MKAVVWYFTCYSCCILALNTSNNYCEKCIGRKNSWHQCLADETDQYVFWGSLFKCLWYIFNVWMFDHRWYKNIYYEFQVGILKNNTLYALRDGIVVVSCEKLNPYPDSPLYERVQKGMVIYKKFWNIYPTPVHAKFKLVSETWFSLDELV